MLSNESLLGEVNLVVEVCDGDFDMLVVFVVNFDMLVYMNWVYMVGVM